MREVWEVEGLSSENSKRNGVAVLIYFSKPFTFED